MQGGIEKLLKLEPGSTVQYLLADDATWAKWAWLREAELWRAVALQSHLDPDLLWSWSVFKGDIAALQANRDKPWADPRLAARLLDNVELAADAVRTLDLQTVGSSPGSPETSVVSVAEFHAWSMRASLMPVPIRPRDQERESA